MRLKGKTAWLAGVGTGMGRATAILFAQEGANVVITARNPQKLEETASRIRKEGGTVTVAPGDLTKKTDVEQIVENIVTTYGQLEIAYCAAGGSFEPNRDFNDINEKFWFEAIENTLTSLYQITQACRPVMKVAGGGSIVAVSASFSVRQEGNPAYGAAKGGIIGFAKNLARELYPDNIRVNLIGAGLFRSPIRDGKISPAPNILSRTGHPEDIAYAAAYLASDEASWVTGQLLSVDGGVDVGTRGIWEHEPPKKP